MSRRPIEFEMSREDQKTIRELLRAGIQPVRVVLRAIVLEQLMAGHTAPSVARIVHLSPQAVRRIAHRYRQGGIAGALFERQGVARSNCWRSLKSSGLSRWFAANRPRAKRVGQCA